MPCKKLLESPQYCENFMVSNAEPSMISQWSTKNGESAYSMYLNIKGSIQTPWMVLRECTGKNVKFDIAGPPLVNSRSDTRNQDHINVFRACLDKWIKEVVNIFKNRMMIEDGMLIGDDCKVSGMYRHNYETYTDTMNIKVNRLSVYMRNRKGWYRVKTKGHKNKSARCMIQIKSVHYINDVIYITLGATQMEIMHKSRIFEINE